jgi:ATP-dependent RNA helicase DBP3
MSSDDSESDDDDRVVNSFAGLSLGDSSSSSEDDNDDSDREIDAIAKYEEKAWDVKDTSRGAYVESSSDSDSDSSEEEEEGVDDAPENGMAMSSFDHLTGRVTRNGTRIPADLEQAIKQVIGGDDPKPSEIQSKSWTTLLTPSTCDRDVIAISKTGSGKTLAFLVPLLASLLAEKTKKATAVSTAADYSTTVITPPTYIYPRAIILAPTRVLANQIFEIASALVANTPSFNNNKDNNPHAIKVAVALGGAGYHQQMAELRATDPDLLIATPGRLNSLCGHVAQETATTTAAQEKGSVTVEDDMCIKLDEISELVIDEADMMLALGFKEDLAWFAQLVNVESAYGFRLVLTSATWDEETSGASLSQFESLSDQEPVLLTAGGAGAGQVVTKNVTQRVEVVFQKGAPRFNRLCKLLKAALDDDNDTTKNNNSSSSSSRIIVFCLHKSQARQVAKDLKHKAGIPNVVLEGDMSQSARVAAIEAFRNGSQGRVLVATDVAGRGLDFNVSHVFNYSVGISIESYIHRCGRTGRAGRFGVAHTFVVKGVDEKLSPELCGILRQANQLIPDDLRIMAGKELKKRQAHRVSDSTGANKANNAGNDKYMDEDDPEELRRANRAKQLRQTHSKQQGNSKRRGRS